MLSEADTLLITAAVDGELTPEEARAFQQLLAASKSALNLHTALLDDRDRVASLPKVFAPAKLYTTILDQLSPPTKIERNRPAVRLRRGLLTASMAASFLVAVASGAFWFATESRSPRISAKQLQQLPKDDVAIAPTPETSIRGIESDPTLNEIPSVPELPHSTNPPTVVAKNETPKVQDVPESKPGIFAAPFGGDVKAFDRVDVKLPLLTPFTDFAQDDSQVALRAHLVREPASRIDIFAKDSTRAAEALLAAAKTHNLNVIVETIANERLKRKMPSTWVIFTDMLTPEDVSKWLATAAETEAALTSPSLQSFGSAHVLPAAAQEQKDAITLLGIDMGLGKKPRETPANSHISTKTIDQVTSAMQKNDTNKTAILITYLPPLVRVHPALSKDIKQYHETRKDRKPGTVPLFLVIRAANS